MHLEQAVHFMRHDLLGKVEMVFGPLLAGAFGLVTKLAISDVQHTPAGLTIWVLICGAAGALFTALPRIISARSAASSALHQQRDSEIDRLIARIHDSYKIDIKVARTNADRHQRIAMLERRSKHKALSECQRLTFHIALLEELVRENGGTAPEFRVTPYHEIVGDLDDQIQQVVNENGVTEKTE